MQNDINNNKILWRISIILLILLVGTLLEWKTGLIEWAK
jgi:NADH:ubiquinone oxidoreductase subunit 3 (subunit A)